MTVVDTLEPRLDADAERDASQPANQGENTRGQLVFLDEIHGRVVDQLFDPQTDQVGNN